LLTLYSFEVGSAYDVIYFDLACNHAAYKHIWTDVPCTFHNYVGIGRVLMQYLWEHGFKFNSAWYSRIKWIQI